jgi:hypothetical protein
MSNKATEICRKIIEDDYTPTKSEVTVIALYVGGLVGGLEALLAMNVDDLLREILREDAKGDR